MRSANHTSLREIGHFEEYSGNLLIAEPIAHRKSLEIVRSCQRIRFKDNSRSITEFKVYRIKSASIKRVKEYQSAAEAINVAAKCINEYFEQWPEARENLISYSRFIEGERNYLKLSNHNYCTFNSHQNRTASPKHNHSAAPHLVPKGHLVTYSDPTAPSAAKKIYLHLIPAAFRFLKSSKQTCRGHL